ncbi:glycoside hydrolase superfamily [Chaetomium sp. MPI-CAGE-AT-0009]|nr:glycoside hydrolase superfamily [Chaetomium sp. MPI-CAGE-AT-0009]
MILPSLFGLAALCHVAAAQDVVTSDTYFYGQSEPVYPTPNNHETGPWADAVAKARRMVAQMTLEEKVNLTAGAPTETGCNGFIPGVPRLGFPGLCLVDAGNGVRGTDLVNAYPSGLHVGASWNRKLARARGHYMGGEAKLKGVNVLLGPFIGPIGRVVEGGRNWEGFSVDPYLTGQLVYETVTGTQGAGVITSTKHLIAQEQETHRLYNPTGNPNNTVFVAEAVSSNLDDRTIHELYLWPFADAVRAGTGNVMCSFNRLNNTYACHNSKSQNGLLKGELGFQGFVVSDWGAQRAGVASALGGLDVAMPSASGKWGPLLVEAVNNGSVPAAQLDNMVTRIVAAWYRMGQDKDYPPPGHGMPADLSRPHELVEARNPEAASTLWDGAVEGHVLVKNAGALPLKKRLKVVSLFGYSFRAPSRNNLERMAAGQRFSSWSVGVQSANISEVNQGWFDSLLPHRLAIAPNGTIISGGGSGAAAWSTFSAPYDAFVSRARKEGTALYWDFDSGNPAVMGASQACVVAGNVWATEGYDRPSVRDEYTDNLILSVASQCANTIVVFHNAGTRLVDKFADHPNVTAIIFAHLPGQDSGEALVSLLYGDENPSGRLPYSVARDEADYGDLLKPHRTVAPNRFQHYPQSDFAEGVYLDYRRFDALNITPRYEFGFGLSYTTFEYANLRVARTGAAAQPLPTGAVAEGGRKDLWDVVAVVEADVTNSGGRDGKEVAQLYVGIPTPAGQDAKMEARQPVRQLRGFDKPLIKAGQTTTVKFELTRRDLSVWDVVAQEWRLQPGSYAISVGRSSRDLPLKGSLRLGGARWRA